MKKKKNIFLKKYFKLFFLKKYFKFLILKSIIQNSNIQLKNKKKYYFLYYLKKKKQICIVTGQHKSFSKNFLFSRFLVLNYLKMNDLQNFKLK